MGHSALWNLGFRPFYLLASVFGAVSALGWALQYAGLPPWPWLQGPLWHGHEMLFGFTLAVVAGFLLTAVRNWTGVDTPSGLSLMALAALWLAGRLLVPWPLWAALANIAFPVALAAAIAVPLYRARNLRNAFFPPLLLGMGLLSGLWHMALLGYADLSPRLLLLGLDVMLFIMVVVGGRVIPMFTNNGVPGASAARHALVERLAPASVLLLLAADLLQLPAAAITAVTLFAALAHGLRLWLWRSWRTLRAPLVWILHVAYAWIVIHLLLRALSAAGWVAQSHAYHALTVGAIGGLTLGMMTRTARGHTGRMLVADGWELTCFLLIQAAALSRVFGGLLSAALYLPSIVTSGLLWSAAYGLYTLRYWPVLSRPRIDGRPG
jgi:uncharacterized protein involved in response to NO